MTETVKNIDQAKENLSATLAALEQKYPKIVEILMGEVNDVVYDEATGKYKPSRNLYYHDVFEPEDRLSSLLFLTQKILISQNEREKGFSGFIQNIKRGKEIEENLSLAKEIREWISENEAGWVYRDTDSYSATGVELFLGFNIPMHQETIPPRDWTTFPVEAGKSVFTALKNGMAVNQILKVLDTKEYLIPFIGPEKKFTAEEIRARQGK